VAGPIIPGIVSFVCFYVILGDGMLPASACEIAVDVEMIPPAYTATYTICWFADMGEGC